MEQNINHRENNTNGLFFIEKEHKIIAEMQYNFTDKNEITVNHTEVKPELKGKGVGTKLLDALAEYARKNNLKVIPLCPFVEVQFSRYQKYNDIKKQ